ncbi:hypothetical protein [Nitrosomonas cryotolerans]|nr:hypothetical protein [Nitrosomonas cryotolerans]
MEKPLVGIKILADGKHKEELDIALKELVTELGGQLAWFNRPGHPG